MPEISAKDVMALRNQTGLSMMECKKALQEANGDAAAAEELLKKKMKGKMDTRTDRAAGEGRIAIALSKDGRNAAIVELRAETDFTAKNDEFAKAVQSLLDEAMNANAGAVSTTDAMTKTVDNLHIASCSLQ